MLGYRFDVDVLAGLAERHRATFTIGAITAFIAVMNHPAVARHDLSSLVKVYSGGAPIAPTTVADFENASGRTSTTSTGSPRRPGRASPCRSANGRRSIR